MTEEQVKSLKLGIAPIDDRTILLVESGFEWINRNTSLIIDHDDSEALSKLSANIRLFIVKYFDVMAMATGVTSESISGLSQSFDTSNKSDLIWQFAEELLGEYITSQFSFTSAKARWSHGCKN